MTKKSFGPTEPIVYLKTIFLGAALVNAAAFSWIAGKIIYAEFGQRVSSGATLSLCLLAVVVHLMYAYYRDAIGGGLKIIRSWRFDLLILFVFGLCAGWVLKKQLTTFFFDLARNIDAPLLLMLVTGTVIGPIAFFVRRLSRHKVSPQAGSVLDDKEISEVSQDAFEMSDRATAFAAHVATSDGSVAFGVDAPWGTGKSSFIFLCQQHWANEKCVVYKFEPLRYAEDPNLIDQFLTGLINEIQKFAFVPELKPALNRYARALKGKADISLGLVKFNLESQSDTVDDMLDDLAFELSRVRARVIVIVDDLDRIGASSAKKVLFAIKKSFNLPNLTYVLCYDTEILSQENKQGTDSATAREFLEKFVNVKIGLFVSPVRLTNYMRGTLRNSINEWGLLSPSTVFTMTGVITAISDLYIKDEGWRYRRLLGDIRKVKRFINLLLVIRIGDVRFDVQDFNNEDLINLLLLYLTYPRTFRSIYASESEGQQGIFSIRRDYAPSGYQYKNSSEFDLYLDTCDPDEKFLLTQLFGSAKVTKIEGSRDEDAETRNRTRAYNNDRHQRNLERYLALIVDVVAPEPRSSLAFYRLKVNEFKKGKSLERLLSQDEFSTEKVISEFWRVLASRARELDSRQADAVIKYLLEKIPTYSVIEDREIGIGYRDGAVTTLLQLLDEAGWSDEKGDRRNNTDKNVGRIADWIFGEADFLEGGIVQTLGEKVRGAIGIFDLLLFRLYCNPGRGSLFNLNKALIKHGDINAPTSGVTTDLNRNAVRKISQRIYALFEARYITTSQNFFDDVQSLSLKQLAGNSAEIVQESLIEDTDNKISNRIAIARTRILGFSVYQLSSPSNGDAVGCGYFDREGSKDGGDIGKLMSAYIFFHCFSPALNSANIFHFCDFMLNNLSRDAFGNEWGPTETGLAGGLRVTDLKAYWFKFRDQIIPLKDDQVRMVLTENYSAKYSEYLPAVFSLLDGMTAASTEESDVGKSA